MILVEGGTFLMGDDASRYANEKPAHPVTVGSFYIGRYTVPQKEWTDLMGGNPSYNKGENLPAENILWHEAVEFCNKKSKDEGLTPIYIIDKYRKDNNPLKIIKNSAFMG